MSDWQPIETAPRDGTDIIVYYTFATIDIVHVAFWDEADDFDWNPCGFKTREDKQGWWASIEGTAETKLEGWTMPTHWKPFSPPVSP